MEDGPGTVYNVPENMVIHTHMLLHNYNVMLKADDKEKGIDRSDTNLRRGLAMTLTYYTKLTGMEL